MDADTGKFYFIEVNPRIQVEHTVTEQVTGVDIVKAQIRITEGAKSATRIPRAAAAGHRLTARACAAVPGHHRRPGETFTPDYGRISVYRSAAGFGIRLDAGTPTRRRDHPFYDSLLVKVTAWGITPTRPHRAWIGAARIPHPRLATNLQFLENVIAHPQFRRAGASPASSTTRRSCSFPEAARPGDAPCEIPRRGHGQRQPGDEGPGCPSCRSRVRLMPDLKLAAPIPQGHA